jgi:hypothetical protein
LDQLVAEVGPAQIIVAIFPTAIGALAAVARAPVVPVVVIIAVVNAE